MAKARQQYFADEVTLQKENRDFAIQPELIEKLESIEAGAQVNVIETVKVNGEALIPDENKAVDVSVPLVEDTLYSTDTDKALSANQGKVLYEYIQNLASRGRYLSNWNTVTGLPTTNPVDNPYQYRAGDYYVVSNVAVEGGTNYRPNGSSYSWGVASTTVESEVVKVGDYYTYDGQYWLLLVNTAREIAVDSSLSTTSTNPVENRVITNALNTKQNNISDLETIRSGAALGATALQPGDSLSELTGTSDDITQGTTNLFMTTAERSKLSNQSGVNTGDETQTTIKNKLGQASTSTDGYLTSTDWNTFNNKQGTISDLETIRSNASAGKNASDTIATYGDIVTHDADEFATASQGGKADTAIQPGDNVSELTNDAGYITDAYHDSTKQDKLIAGANIQIAADGKTISATDTTYVAGDFDIKDLADSTGLRAEWSGKQDELIAGTNIQIAADGKTISATDTTYTAGPGISISNNNVISNTQTSAEWGNIQGTLSNQTDLQSALDAKQDALTAGDNITIEERCEWDTQGPAPSGFHVPNSNEWETLCGILTTTFGMAQSDTTMGTYLKMPMAGFCDYENAFVYNTGVNGNYWSSSPSDNYNAYFLNFDSSSISQYSDHRAFGYSVRCFKNSPTVPTPSWTTLYQGTGNAGVFWNNTDGLISVSGDGVTWYTIMDKNLGATTVFNQGDTETDANCGYFYQFGNNYGFPHSGTFTSSYEQVDASNYGPGNYYNSNTFIAGSYDWSSVQNDNLWGGVSQGQLCRVAISATDTTYTAGTGIDITNGVISNTQTSAEWGNITGTLSDQTDLQTALDAKQDDMVILKYGISTWNDFITAYQKNGVVYCRASSNSNPASGSQTRLAFMAYVNNETSPTEVEFQYYRSRADHNSAANQLDQVFVYKLTSASGGTWTVTERNTAAKATAGTGINLTYGSGNMTIANTGVTSINSQTGDVTLTIPTVPTNVSDFVNDAGYITANDLPTVDTSMSDSSTNAVQNNVIKNYVDTQVQEATSGAVSDTAYGTSWNGITGIAPSKNAVYDKISAMDTTIAGKQNTISDLSTIRSGAALGATALQSGDNVSELINDAGFITKAVSDLTNYYTKSETYTKSEVADYVANFAGFKVVATLPTTDIKTTIIYLLGPVGTGADKYEEYIYSNNAWVKIGETSVDLTNYFNTSTDNSDSITQGSTNLFLTTAERTKLSNTSGTNTGDETKATIQSKLGAATSSNDGYLTSADWATFNNKLGASAISDTAYGSGWDADTTHAPSKNAVYDKISAMDTIIAGKADASDVNTKMFPLPAQGTDISEIISQLNNGGGVLFYAPYSDELATVIGNRYYLVIDYDMQSGTIKAKGDFSNATITLTSGTTTVASVTTGGENVKKFSLSSTSDTSTAEKIVSWYNGGNIPVVVYDSVLYVFHNYQYSSQNGKSYYTFLANTASTDGTSTSSLINKELTITYNPNAALQFSINTFNDGLGGYLKTGVNYSTPYTPEYDGSPATKKYVDDAVAQAGETYNAGEGIAIGDVTINGRKGPSPDGFHVPSTNEWQGVNTIMTSLSLTAGDNWRINLHIPYAGSRNNSSASLSNQGSRGCYWSSSPYGSGLPSGAYYLRLDSFGVAANNYTVRAFGFSVRCFKDSYVTPDSTWTVIQGTLGNAGIFWNQSEGLISITDGSTGYTMMDKNLGATTVYNDGDTLTQDNMGNMYQWGNNYGFPSTGTISNTSSTQVDASAYGPTNPYSSDTFITGNEDWSSVHNDNLWGDTTGGTVTIENVISNTGVLSVNGQTGDVTITAGDMNYTDFGWQAKTGASITLDLASTYTPSADFTVNAPATIKDGQTYILRVVNEDTAYTMTLGTNVTNPFGTDITLTDYGIDQFVFLAIGGNLELQPEGGGGGGAITADTTGTETSISKIWVGTEEEYTNLGTYEENVAYMTY